MKKWKILKTKDVSPSKWFPVIQHKVQLGNGAIIDDYFISPLGNVAMILPFTKDNYIVLVKQYKHAIGKIVIELPAGYQQKGNTIKQSAINELEEETGIKTKISNLIPLGKIANNPTKTTQISYGFMAKNLEFNSQQNTDTTEEIEIIKARPQQVIDMLMKGEIWGADSVAFILKAYYQYPKLFNIKNEQANFRI
jgi:8-oxo-dGTP pyrophosphatase MutT (NUDIX family)